MTESTRVPVAEGVELAVDAWPGAGTPFLLVHGLASNRQLWRPVAERLAAAGHPVATVDLRGHGESDRPVTGYDLASMAADVVAASRGLGFDRPVVVGQSYGGNLALEIAHRFASSVRGVAAVDGGVLDLAGRWADWEACKQALSPPRFDITMSELREMVGARMREWPHGSVEAVMACFEETGDGRAVARLAFDRHLAILRSMWEQRPAELLKDLSVPVLLLPCDTGDHDWTHHKRLAITSAGRDDERVRVRWFEADHDVHLQRPDEVAGVLLEAEVEGFFQ